MTLRCHDIEMESNDDDVDMVKCKVGPAAASFETPSHLYNKQFHDDLTDNNNDYLVIILF